MNKEEEHSLDCPNCDENSKYLGTLEDTKKTDFFFCYNCKEFFGIPDDGDIYVWVGDRGVEANFNEDDAKGRNDDGNN